MHISLDRFFKVVYTIFSNLFEYIKDFPLLYDKVYIRAI